MVPHTPGNRVTVRPQSQTSAAASARSQVDGAAGSRDFCSGPHPRSHVIVRRNHGLFAQPMRIKSSNVLISQQFSVSTFLISVHASVHLVLSALASSSSFIQSHISIHFHSQAAGQQDILKNNNSTNNANMHAPSFAQFLVGAIAASSALAFQVATYARAVSSPHPLISLADKQTSNSEAS